MRAKVARRHTCHYPRRESGGAPGNLGSGPHGFGYRSVCCLHRLIGGGGETEMGGVVVLIIFNGLEALS